MKMVNDGGLTAPGATISRELYEFFVSWRQWVQDGAPEKMNSIYCRGKGLCESLPWYAASKEVKNLFYGLSLELSLSFVRLCGSKTFCPFGGICTYYNERYDRTMHLNPYRLAFVGRMIAEYEAAHVAPVKP